uniref:Inositol monophosphatase 1 n=1 Tax=Hucho hucho TaxID=62062 RepID=A0A4W5M8B0_9TELE
MVVAASLRQILGSFFRIKRNGMERSTGKILEEYLFQFSLHQRLGEEFTFQQDDNLQHNAKSTLELLTKKTIEFGIVYSCQEDKMYIAWKGKGAFCNREPIKVSVQEGLLYSLANERGHRHNIDLLTSSLTSCPTATLPYHSIRSPVNMCLVACGVADAYYLMSIHCWDMAGGAAIIREARGIIMNTSGGPFDLTSRMLSANNKTIADRIIKEIDIFPAKKG